MRKVAGENINGETAIRWKRVTISGWGRTERAQCLAARPECAAQLEPAMADAGSDGLLARGLGRSYGDAALVPEGRVILTERLDRILSFDADSGDLVAEAGVTIGDLVDTFLPQGFLPPVNPGTGFVTLGGAVANDVHGKNHETAGSFGDHVAWLEILLPTGETVRTSVTEKPDLFAATLGGIGLTGIIKTVCLRLRAVPSNAVRRSHRRVRDLDDFLALLSEPPSDTDRHSVGWIDGLATGRNLGRGLFETAVAADGDRPPVTNSRLSIPFTPMMSLVRPLVVRSFNKLYRARIPAAGRNETVHWRTFLFPLDRIGHWNRIYGRAGFRQFQCVIPMGECERGIPAVMEAVVHAGAASFLSVIKRLGGEGRGLLSFPLNGITLALDFPRRANTDALMERLERLTVDHGGRAYLAKDSHMSAPMFSAMYPQAERFRAALRDIDPAGRLRSTMALRLGLAA